MSQGAGEFDCATTATTSRSHRFANGKSAGGRERAAHYVDLGDGERERSQHRCSRNHNKDTGIAATNRIAASYADRFHDVHSVRVTVPAPPAVPSEPSEDELFSQNVKDIYFDFDNADIRYDQQSAIERDAAFLAQHAKINLTIEGTCDERGSIEYNLALGDKRANAVKEMLLAGGVSSANVKTISFGKEKPVCDEHDESCWQQNRRGHFSR
jgi:peptidoglycan-associated lipoprotein